MSDIDELVAPARFTNGSAGNRPSPGTGDGSTVSLAIDVVAASHVFHRDAPPFVVDGVKRIR
jgi:hypothetical protein